MKRLPVVSNSIRSIGYDQNRQQLELEFHTGRVYRYGTGEQPFPHRLYRRFINAQSLGSFFHAEIRPMWKGFELPARAASRAEDEEPET